jgi:hypothetical protein
MTTTPIATEDLRCLFDIVTNSMDFGSGFLDREEADLIRRVAVLLGVDPMEGTPTEFAQWYPHAFAPAAGKNRSEVCKWGCRKPADDAIHSAMA